MGGLSMIELIEQGNTEALAFFIEVRAVIILFCWGFMVAACMIDFWSGISTAKALGEKLMSHGFRKTVTKACDYARLLMFTFMFDVLGSLLTFYKLPFASMLCVVAIIVIEGKSVLENSRRKKANVADVPDIVKEIVKTVNTKQGVEVLNKITEMLNEKDK